MQVVFPPIMEQKEDVWMTRKKQAVLRGLASKRHTGNSNDRPMSARSRVGTGGGAVYVILVCMYV